MVRDEIRRSRRRVDEGAGLVILPLGARDVSRPANGPTYAVIPAEVVDKRVHRGDATERSMGPLGVVLVKPWLQPLETLGVGAIGTGIGPLVEERLDEPLGPYIVLIRVSETDGAVAGEPNAMAALRYAADGQVGWSWARMPAIAGHGAARLTRSGLGPGSAERSARSGSRPR